MTTIKCIKTGGGHKRKFQGRFLNCGLGKIKKKNCLKFGFTSFSIQMSLKNIRCTWGTPYIFPLPPPFHPRVLQWLEQIFPISKCQSFVQFSLFILGGRVLDLIFETKKKFKCHSRTPPLCWKKWQILKCPLKQQTAFERERVKSLSTVFEMKLRWR